MMKKRIAFVVAFPGSASAFLKDHFIQLVKEYDVSLIANFSEKGAMDKFVKMGITCYSIPINRRISLINDAKALMALVRLFKRQRFDSVHSVTPKAGLLTAIAGWIVGTKNRIHIFTGQIWATRKGPMKLLLKLSDRLIAVLDTSILADGKSQRRFLIKEGVVKEKKSIVLANGSICGVNLSKYVISEEVRKAQRTKFGFRDEDVVFIFMGRLNHDKGIGELYEAFNRLVSDHPRSKLILYGADEEGYGEKVKDFDNIKVNDNFFYPGQTSNPYESLQGGDVFVLPSWREGFGSSVIEAQALGLPVITSDAYGVQDASDPGVTGLRCKVNDPQGLYECMKKYYDCPELRKAHGEAGRRRVGELFDNKTVTSAWLDFYHILLN